MSTKKIIRHKFRAESLERDGYKCVMCNISNDDVDLEVHHITDRSIMPNGGYVKENGISLCPKCHKDAEDFHKNAGDSWIEGFHPNELYEKIGSNYELAVEKSKELDNA